MSNKDNKRVLWIGDMVTPTGFSRVNHSILKYLDLTYYDVFGLGINYHGDPHEYPYKIYPAQNGADIYGFRKLSALLKQFKFDMIFILNDAWVVADYLNVIKNELGNNIPPIVTYIPADGTDHAPDWYKNFDIVTEVVAYNNFGKSVIDKASGRDAKIISHGVDTEVFYKHQLPREELRNRLLGDNYPDAKDLFIVFSGNRNQPRKKLDIVMKAFSIFAEGKPDNVKLYMHCGVVDEDIDVLALANRLGIGKRLMISGTGRGVQSVPVEVLNLFYNISNVGVNTGLGEGFGLVNVEHAVTGAPQVVANHSALTELYEDCGILIDPITDWTHKGIMTTGALVSPYDVAYGLELLYSDKDLYNRLSERCLEKFTSKEFSWEHNAKKFDELFRKVMDEHTVSES